MSITATELKKNLNKYLMLAATEDVYITNPFQDRVDVAKSLFGILPQTTTYEEAMDERAAEL